MTYTLFVASNGSDSADGLTSAAALKTLAQAQVLLHAAQPDDDVEVRIAPGTYTQPATLEWTFYVPGKTVTFAPTGYVLGEGGWTQRPLFKGGGVDGWWLWARPSTTPDTDGRLRFYYLDAHKYARGGLRFDGNTSIDPATGQLFPGGPGNGHHYVFGCQFRYMGSKHCAGEGYGAVNLVNSSDNVITNSHFLDLENLGGTVTRIHGIYIAHHSCRNQVTDSRFAVVSGDPIRVRNRSNRNKIYRNSFTQCGWDAYFSDWNRDVDYVLANPDSPLEMPCQGNEFRWNDLVSTYQGRPSNTFRLPVPPGYTGPANDYHGIMPGWEPIPRLYTSGNT